MLAQDVRRHEVHGLCIVQSDARRVQIGGQTGREVHLGVAGGAGTGVRIAGPVPPGALDAPLKAMHSLPV